MTRLLLVAAVALVAMLAAAGLGAGAERNVYPGAGTPIQDAINASYQGDSIYVYAGTNARECGGVQAGYAGWCGCGDGVERRQGG